MHRRRPRPCIAVDPDDPADAYVGCGLRGTGLYRTTDGGASADAVGFDDRWVWGLARRPDDPGRIYAYAAEDDPLYASDDGGRSWSAVGEDLPPARPADTLRLHPADPETVLYVGETERGTSHAFVSADAGETSERVGRPLPKVWRLAVAPAPDG